MGGLANTNARGTVAGGRYPSTMFVSVLARTGSGVSAQVSVSATATTLGRSYVKYKRSKTKIKAPLKRSLEFYHGTPPSPHSVMAFAADFWHSGHNLLRTVALE